MSWRRGGFISERLTEVLIPVCVYGMLASLVMHMIDLRAIFVADDIGRLRLASLAFAAAVVLLERLAYLEGSFIARNYRYAVGFTITFFAINFTRTCTAFGLALLLYLILWWCGHKLSAAVSVNDDKALTEAAEGGIMRKFRFPFRKKKSGKESGPEAKTREKAISSTGTSRSTKKGRGEPRNTAATKPGEEHWSEKLSSRHPGRALLYFSLFAVPAFGVGLILFDPAETPLWRLGLLFFLYLWCALSLLFLSSLRQLAVYFRRREVSLPDLIGLPWLALGFLGVTVVLGLAFLLPQPPSPLGLPVRSQLVTTYKGWESKYGLSSRSRSGSGSGSGGEKDKGGWTKEKVQEYEKNKYAEIDKINDPAISEYARSTGAAPEAKNLIALSAAFNDSMTQIFRGVVRVILGLAGVSAVVVAIITIGVFIKRLRDGAGESLDKARKWFLGDGKKKPRILPATRRFPGFADPFGDPARLADRNALIRYLWEALLAFCADAGAPCSPDLTPLEFVDTAPEPLLGFEERARFIARLFTFSQFSSQPLAETSLADLQRFWYELQRHAAGV